MSQTDFKRVLAYSTISQLGLMFLACGVGAFYAAMFHLTTHAFMKALLFLSAGNVVHMTRGETDMRKMGSLYKKFPITHILFFIGVLAMSGIPPLAAFFSKDLILEEELYAGYKVLFTIGLFVSILTAFYLTRAYCLTFMGKSHLEEKTFKTIKEAPPIMLIPVAILALLSTFGGFLGFTTDKPALLENFLAKSDVIFLNHELINSLTITPGTWLSIIGGILGMGLAFLIYTQFRERCPSPIQFFKNSFYVNEIYWALIVYPLQALSNSIVYFFEPKIFEGLLDLCVNAIQKISKILQTVQSGQIRSYIAWMALGMAFFIFYLVF
jgi:NADH-quinone oxidoreductase subunit L